MIDASDTLDMSMVGNSYALTPVLSTELKIGDIALVSTGSRLLSPIRMTHALIQNITKLEPHLVMTLGRV